MRHWKVCDHLFNIEIVSLAYKCQDYCFLSYNAKNGGFICKYILDTSYEAFISKTNMKLLIVDSKSTWLDRSCLRTWSGTWAGSENHSTTSHSVCQCLTLFSSSFPSSSLLLTFFFYPLYLYLVFSHPCVYDIWLLAYFFLRLQAFFEDIHYSLKKFSLMPIRDAQ